MGFDWRPLSRRHHGQDRAAVAIELGLADPADTGQRNYKIVVQADSVDGSMADN